MEQPIIGDIAARALIYPGVLVAAIALPLLLATIRQPLFLSIATRNIIRAPLQSSLITFGLMMGSLVITVSLALGDSAAANLGGGEITSTAFSTAFSFFGIFSIIAGALLIVLIFFLLSTSRRSELGVMRAIGLKRYQLVHIFALEGMIYAAVGSAIGVLLGVAFTWAILRYFVSSVDNLVMAVASAVGDLGLFGDVTFTFSVQWSSLLLAYFMGLVLTLLTVIIASLYASRLNIVAAIRDLPPDIYGKIGKGFWGRLLDALVWFGGPVILLLKGMRQQSVPRVVGGVLWILPCIGVAIPTVVVAIVGGGSAAFLGLFITTVVLWTFVGALKLLAFLVLYAFITGVPLLVGSAVGFVILRVNLTAETANTLVYAVLMLALAILGVVLLVLFINNKRKRPLQLLNRFSLSVGMILLLVLWYFDPQDAILSWIFGGVAIPNDSGLSVFLFILFGTVFMSVAAVVLFMSNSAFLIRTGNYLFTVFKKMRPAWTMAVAYSLIGSKGRTGLILTMFVVVVFTLTLFSVVTNTFISQPLNDIYDDVIVPAINDADQLQDEGLSAAEAEQVREFFGTLWQGIQGVVNAFLRLFQVYMGLGLITGTIAVGIIAFRSVVERRHSIGIMRAIGSSISTVRAWFLFENTFIAFSGTLIGVLLGLAISYRIVSSLLDNVDLGSDPFYQPYFAIPWGTILLMVGVVTLASFVITFGAALQASRIEPARTIRDE